MKDPVHGLHNEFMDPTQNLTVYLHTIYTHNIRIVESSYNCMHTIRISLTLVYPRDTYHLYTTLSQGWDVGCWVFKLDRHDVYCKLRSNPDRECPRLGGCKEDWILTGRMHNAQSNKRQ